MNTEKKPTLATVKAFIRKNKGSLYIAQISAFSGMSDMVEYRDKDDRSFVKADETGAIHENELGVKGAWFVFDSRDRISRIERDGFTGFHVYNCCGSFDIAIKKEAA